MVWEVTQRLVPSMSGGSMTANHLEHEIATFPGSPSGRRRRPSGDWNDDDYDVLAEGLLRRVGFFRVL